MSELTAPAPRPRTENRGALGRVILALVVVGVFVGLPLGRFLLQPEAETAVAPPTRVVTTTPIRADAEITVRYSGNLIPESSTVVVPKTSGRVTRMLVSQNEIVQAGQLIAEIEDDVLRLQLAQAQAAYEAADAMYRQAIRGVRSTELEIAAADIEQAEGELETARSALTRSERLYEAGAIARSDYEAAVDRFSAAETKIQNARRQLSLMQDGAGEEELDAARANADAALRRVELAQLQLGYASITAPVGGSVASVLAEEGQVVGPSSALVSIVNDRLIRARIRVPERLYGQFRGREGAMIARVYAEAYDDPFVGRVTTVAAIIDAASRTFEVEVAIPNADGRLRPGMYVSTQFVIDTYEDSLQVPDTAFGSRVSGSSLFVVSDGAAALREVENVDLPGPMTIVASGLDDADAVIVEGSAFLADGDPIEVVERQ